MSRRKGRILAFQSLYSYDVGGIALDDIFSFSWVDGGSGVGIAAEDELAFARLLVGGTVEHLPAVDEQIKKFLSPKWEFDRVDRVALAILRMSVYALLFQRETAPSIVIDEAVDIAKEFGPDDSYKFINALLDNVHKANALPA